MGRGPAHGRVARDRRDRGRESAVDLVVDALAVHRLTRMVIEDRVPLGWLRSSIVRRAYAKRENDATGGQPYVVELLSCPWCMSVWVAFGVAVVRRFVPRVWRPLAQVLAASSVTGLLAGWEEH